MSRPRGSRFLQYGTRRQTSADVRQGDCHASRGLQPARSPRNLKVEAHDPRRSITCRFAFFVSGLIGLLWLLLRTGSKPSRIVYPCQQAALGAAAGMLSASGLTVGAAVLPWPARRMRTLVALSVLGTLLAFGAFLPARPAFSPLIAQETPPAGYAPDVFLVNHARGVEPGRYGGVDDLITLMGTRGFKWYQSATQSLTAGPSGLIDRDSVVLLKVNAQWDQRGGTNTDVVRGVIRAVVEHPDGFVGEVIVADNKQGWLRNWDENNAEDITQSLQDVAADFVTEGWSVSVQFWDDIRRAVDEYDEGSADGGYVLSPAWDVETGIKVSYPKFQTAYGTYVSYKHGIWSPDSQSYDPERLVVINMPVLKTHRIYAVTAAVKNHMGVVTTSPQTDSHNAVGRGGLGSFLAEIRMPNLTILDCIWILARPGSGPDASYESASRRDQLVAGTDPLALDAWAVKFILVPQILENEYSVEDFHAWQDPDNPGSKFRGYLDRSMNEMLLAGIETTNDYRSVQLQVWTGDEDRDGDVDLGDLSALDQCATGPGGAVKPGACQAFDADSNNTVDLADVAALVQTFTGSQ